MYILKTSFSEMKKPELKDYNIDEQMIKVAKRNLIIIYMIYAVVIIVAHVYSISSNYQAINYIYNYICPIHPRSYFMAYIIFYLAYSIIVGYIMLLVNIPNKIPIVCKYRKILAMYDSYKARLKDFNKKPVNSDSVNVILKPNNNALKTPKKLASNRISKNRSIKTTTPKTREQLYKIISEGKKSEVKLNKYERNAKARKLCIQHYGCKCYICKISLEKEYGDIAEGFIHVHHIKPISEIGKSYEVDPIKDLIPICPNCHSVIHTKNPPYTIAEMKKKMQEMRRKQ